MKFAYKKIPIFKDLKSRQVSFVYRPIIPVQIKYRDKEVGYEALIDSGADSCIFHSEIAEILDISWEKGKPCSFGGIGGKFLKGFISSPIAISVGGHPIKTSVIFSEEIPSYGYGILGQEGFFRFFRIRFVFQKKTVQITPEPRKR